VADAVYGGENLADDFGPPQRAAAAPDEDFGPPARAAKMPAGPAFDPMPVDFGAPDDDDSLPFNVGTSAANGTA